jgi:hypothetical protein
MAAGAGYSGTPLAQKLGLRDGDRVLFIDLPESLAELTTARRFAEASRVTVEQVGDAEGPYAVVHLFTGARAVLERLIGRLRDLIARDGAIWVSWPKQASGIETDLTEDAIRAAVLPLGLVDVKVCAVDEVWSGLKLVIRKELR